MTDELTFEELDSIFEEQNGVVAQELQKMKPDKKSLENKIFTLALYLGRKEKEDELAELSNKKETKMLKYQGITIQKNPRGSTYYTRYRVGGKQYYVSARTQTECLRKLKKAKSPKNVERLLALQNIFSDNISLENWYNQWLKLYKIDKVKPATLRCYGTLYRQIPQKYKSMRMADFKVMDLIMIVKCNPRERQQQKMHDMLNMIFQKAEDNEIVEKNLMGRVEKPKHKQQHSKALTIEEQNKLAEACSKVENGEVLLVALYQGFRRGEVLGLTRDCVDLEKKKITINKAWTEQGKFDTTKNEQSVRTIPMFESTYNVLLKHKDKLPHERIFNLSMKQYERVLDKVRAESGLYIKMKDMRCTFITNCMNMNFPIHIIQAWVGHQLGSVVTTSIYTTHNDEADFEFIKKLNENLKLQTN